MISKKRMIIVLLSTFALVAGLVIVGVLISKNNTSDEELKISNGEIPEASISTTDSFKNELAREDISLDEQASLRFSLSQIYYEEEKYEEVLNEVNIVWQNSEQSILNRSIAAELISSIRATKYQDFEGAKQIIEELISVYELNNIEVPEHLLVYLDAYSNNRTVLIGGDSAGD